MNQQAQYRKEYISRINRVIDYIDNNIEKELSLEILASEACFSPFHFHRIFSAFVGETLNNYTKRIRLEKCASTILNDEETPISEIAFKYGFNSISVFSRSFKDYFDISASELREQNKVSKISKLNSKNNKPSPIAELYLRDINQIDKRRYFMKAKIEVKEMPGLNLIYVRHTGAFDQIETAYEKLFSWAGSRGLLKFPETKTVSVYHDDPKVTDMEKVRQSACITVDKEVKAEGEIGKMSIDAGKYAVGRFEITEMGFTDAWDTMCHWLSESGYQPDDGLPYELYHNDHTQHPEHKFILDICIPVKPL